MRVRELTPQQLDPLGTIAARGLGLLSTASAVAVSVLGAVPVALNGDLGLVAVASILVIAAAGFVFLWASRPENAPFTQRTHVLVVGIAGFGVLLSYISIWDVNPDASVSLAPLGFGLLTVAMASYRPARELMSVGAVAAVFIAFVALMQAMPYKTSGPPFAYAIIAAAPVVALWLAAAVSSRETVAMLLDWQDVAILASREHAIELRDSIARSVQQERVTVLNRRLVPFYSALLERGTITAADQRRAREIAERLRAAMVAEAERSWLDTLVSDNLAVRFSADARTKDRVYDPDRLAQLLDPTQRTALRAFLVALFQLQAFRDSGFQIRFTGDADTCSVVITVVFDSADQGTRTRISPYLSVMKSAFPTTTTEFPGNSLTLRFSYDRD